MESSITEFKVTPVASLVDNYIWTIEKDQRAVVIDPGDASPVIQYITNNNITVEAIIITHHHHDHTNGIDDLVRHTQAPIYAPDAPRFNYANYQLNEGDSIRLLDDMTLVVMECPGHTKDHIAYYWQAGKSLFCGDALFSAGCGRLFDGSLEQMHQSIERFIALGPQTRIYCTHEYTLANLQFARFTEPTNEHMKTHEILCQQLRDKALATLPTTISKELLINPFVRVSQPHTRYSVEVQSALNLANATTPMQTFKVLRQLKDRF